MNRRYFLIVSNMRSGSTLLETMLGSLEGVFSDLEVKWKPQDGGQKIHMPISEITQDLQLLFEQEFAFSDAPLVGSKLVLDPFMLPEKARLHIDAIIPKDWYIIHLTRSYRDVFLSRLRGAEHLRNKSGMAIKGPRLRDAMTTIPVSNEDSIATRYVDRKTCFDELNIYLNNDLWLSSLTNHRMHYFQIDYCDIFSRFRELLSFLGLDSAISDVDTVIKAPPLEKLPAVPPQRLVANFDELEPLFAPVEDLRSLLILDQDINRNFLPNWQDYQKRGETRFAEGDYAGSISDYSSALKGSPPNAALYFLRGNARLKLADYAGASDDFENGLHLDPDNESLKKLLNMANRKNGYQKWYRPWS